jgi:hypothetical protein
MRTQFHAEPENVMSKKVFKLLLLLAASSVALGQDNGEALFNARCAACHLNPDPQTNAHAPSKEDMARFTPNSVYSALTDGLMRLQATGLTAAARPCGGAALEWLGPRRAQHALRGKWRHYRRRHSEAPPQMGLRSSG